MHEKFAEVSKDVFKETGNGASLTIRDFDKRKTVNEITSVSEKIDATSKSKEKINIDKRISNEKTLEKSRTQESSETKELTKEQKSELIDKGVSSGIVDKMQLSDGKYILDTNNSKLVDQKHPDTKVSYKRKTVDILGAKVEGVFPEFKSKFDVLLSENFIFSKDKNQFEYCNNKLKEAIKENPELRKQFSPRQLEQIEKGITPSGLLWHHNENRGVMQLVDAKQHLNSNHTGGKAIWGGGSQAR